VIDLINEILQTLSHNKLRTALTGFSVAWGIFMLIVLLGMGHGVTNSFTERALEPGSQKINIWGGRTSKAYSGYREGRSITLKNGDISRIEDEHPQFIDEVNSVIYGSTTNISAGKESIKSSYNGVFPSLTNLQGNAKMSAGRFINDKDMSTTAKVVVLPQQYTAKFFPNKTDDEVIGQRVRIGDLSFTIIGIYTANWGRNVYIPYSTAKTLTGNNDELGSISVMLKNLETVDDGTAAEEDIKQTLATTHDFDPSDDSAVWIWNLFSQGMKGLNAVNILNVSIWILGLLTLLSGIVGISNIMFVSVKERTHEIGIRRAIGAKPRSILTQVIAESIAITTLFGYIGIVLGTITTQLLDKLFQNSEFLSSPTVDISIAIEVTIVLIIAGAMAGLFPALKALKVKPVEALRDE
jgi:putative ABC transport system permease protein